MSATAELAVREAASAAEPLVTWSWARHDSAPFTLRATLTEEELEGFFGAPRRAPVKKGVDGLPLISPSLFSSRTRKRKADVEAVTALVFDLDDAPPGADVGALLERELGVAGVIHETYSSRVEAPRYRVILFVSRPMTCEEHGRLIRPMFDVCASVGITVDRKCSDPTRGYYAPARAPGGHYSWRKLAGPRFDVDAALAILDRHVRPVAPPPPVAHRSRPGGASPVDRAAAYVRAMPPAISGSGGHNALFEVCCVLARGFALADHEAAPILAEYNARCRPPWSARELEHKWQGATKSERPLGYLLGGT